MYSREMNSINTIGIGKEIWRTLSIKRSFTSQIKTNWTLNLQEEEATRHLTLIRQLIGWL